MDLGARGNQYRKGGNRVDVYLVGGKVEGWVEVFPGGGVGTGGGSSGN
jgi:hypothetical protein